MRCVAGGDTDAVRGPGGPLLLDGRRQRRPRGGHEVTGRKAKGGRRRRLGQPSGLGTVRVTARQPHGTGRPVAGGGPLPQWVEDPRGVHGPPVHRDMSPDAQRMVHIG